MVSLTRVLNHMAGVNTSVVARWIDPEDRSPANDRWLGIWDDEEKMAVALAAVVWQQGSSIPAPADVIAAKAGREAFETEWAATMSKHAVEDQLRNNPAMKAQVALQAQAQDKTIDEIIAETVSKV